MIDHSTMLIVVCNVTNGTSTNSERVMCNKRNSCHLRSIRADHIVT